jgi:DNA-binding SARP family transcriptional activator
MNIYDSRDWEELQPGDGSENRSKAVISIGLLGPFQVTLNQHRVLLTAGKLRTLLAVLALGSGQTVSIDRLATTVWADQEPPGNVRRSVQTYITRLRTALGPSAIDWTPTGYLLCADPDQVDILRFVQLLDSASAAPDTTVERTRLGQALKLWRGTPFEGVPCSSLTASETPWLLERYLTALERRIDLDIAAGRHGELVPELSELTARHPLRESLWARLLTVLGLSGRRADALARYEIIRRRIASEIGTDPDPILQRIHVDLLEKRLPTLQEANSAQAHERK